MTSEKNETTEPRPKGEEYPMCLAGTLRGGTTESTFHVRDWRIIKLLMLCYWSVFDQVPKVV